jgi:hypothetical protein
MTSQHGVQLCQNHLGTDKRAPGLNTAFDRSRFREVLFAFKRVRPDPWRNTDGVAASASKLLMRFHALGLAGAVVTESYDSRQRTDAA